MRARDLWDVLNNLQNQSTPQIDDTNTVNTDLQAPPADTTYVRDTWSRLTVGSGMYVYDDPSGNTKWGLAQWA